MLNFDSGSYIYYDTLHCCGQSYVTMTTRGDTYGMDTKEPLCVHTPKLPPPSAVRARMEGKADLFMEAKAEERSFEARLAARAGGSGSRLQ